MSDFTTIGLIVAAVVGIVSFVLFHIYSGLHANLASAEVGEVFNFEYEQPYHGDPKRFMAKVIEPVYTLNEDDIRKLNRRSAYRRNDPVFQRTHHLVTCQTSNGEIRQFYAERAKNVRRPLFGGLLIKSGVAALIF